MRRRPLGVVTLSLNLWRVSDAAGEAPDTWLRIDLGEFQLWRHCGMISGSWSATDTLFLTSVTEFYTQPPVVTDEASKGRWAVDDHGRLLTTSGFSTEIGCAGAPVPSWVATARRAASDGDRLVLLGQDGADLGRLTRS
ncbi:hypothetical protein [Pengzhenrongella sp.]|uniref:hypothetical protein n=1 Tax=Pengzhenrongella sp. TaxID=2888820 RepID=UPI002F928066